MILDISSITATRWSETTTISGNLELIALISLVIVTITWYTFIIRSSEKQKYPPGPRGLPLVGHLPFLDPELHTYFTDLSRIYGPIIKLNLGKRVGIVVSSPPLAREVLKDHDTTFANRDVPIAGRITTYGGHDITWTPYGPEWRMLRKVSFRDMLGPQTLGSFHHLRREQIHEMTRYLHTRVGSKVNVGEQIFLTILSVITSTMWGGTVKGEERESMGSEFRKVVAEITMLLGKPNLSDFFPGLARFDLQGVEKQTKELVSRLDRIFESIIDQRLKMKMSDDGSEINDFLESLLKMKDGGDAKTPFTMSHLKSLLMDMVVGGADTTSNTVEFAMAEIINKPEILKKIHEELDTIVGRNNIVEESHSHKLHYLQAVIKETLRLHPALPLLVPHCPSETCTIGGYTVPKGARVFINVWAIHRDPSIWENPSKFEPNRFVDSKFDFSGKDFNYFPFGSGRRICAGIAMAERMSMLLLATLLHSFDWKLPQGEKLDLQEKFGIVLKKKVPLVAIPTPRLLGPSLYQ